MRYRLRLAGAALAVAGALFVTAPPAAAQNLPWCAQVGGDEEGFESCGFYTLEQCRAYISGLGGFCVRNLAEGPPPPRRSRTDRRTR